MNRRAAVCLFSAFLLFSSFAVCPTTAQAQATSSIPSAQASEAKAPASWRHRKVWSREFKISGFPTALTIGWSAIG